MRVTPAFTHSYSPASLDILVVNGDTEIVSTYRCLLSASGWRVDGSPTFTWTPSRQADRPAQPRLLLLCGWDAVRTFTRRLPGPAQAPETVVVAYCPPDAELATDALDHGIDLVITQPCSPPVLVRRIRAALRWAVQ